MTGFRFIPPSAPIPAASPPTDDGWSHELKFDGWRAQLHKQGPSVGILTRRGNDVTRRFPAVAEAIRALPLKQVIIDAELVGHGKDGWPSFDALHRAGAPTIAWCFDIMLLGTTDVCRLPLWKRRTALSKVVRNQGGDALRLSDVFDDPIALLERVESMQFEGIVSKRLDQPYMCGQNPGWLKVKTVSWRAANRERWKMFQKV